MMDERRPEAWLGNFLVILEISAGSFSTIAGARQDEELRARLATMRNEAAEQDPLRLLDPAFEAELKESDWGKWWQVQAALTSYSYSTLSLAMLGDLDVLEDVTRLYNQENNPRLRKDAHYVLCYLLGRSWPASAISQADISRLRAG